MEPASMTDPEQQIPRSARNDRRLVLAAVLALINVPLLIGAIGGVSFYRTNHGNGSIISSGQRRAFMLRVPRSYDPARATPLIISLHGAGLWGAAQEDNSQWDRVGDREGLIVVYPSAGGGREVGPRIWHAELTRDSALQRDVRFIADLIDTLRSRYNIDTTRIYANGLSNGGGMSFVLSCLMPDRIAAVGLVGSAQTLPWQWCADSTPVPMIDMHGTLDRQIPYEGGHTWISADEWWWPDQEKWVTNWARRNRCDPEPHDSVFAADVRRRTYAHCANGADVVLYTIVGGGHTWPGGGPLPEWFVGKTTRSIDGSALMWQFFRDHPLRR
jgi:polyhydroxybutyrate depolymerase